MVIGNQSGRIYERDQAIGVDPNHSGEFSTPIQALNARAGCDRNA
jgi:hypothetical protein